MKIGLVCWHYLATKGGLERYALSLTTELMRQGHEVHVFANSGEISPGVHFHHVPVFPLSSPAKNLSFAFMAAKRTKAVELDVTL